MGPNHSESNSLTKVEILPDIIQFPNLDLIAQNHRRHSQLHKKDVRKSRSESTRHPLTAINNLYMEANGSKFDCNNSLWSSSKWKRRNMVCSDSIVKTDIHRFQLLTTRRRFPKLRQWCQTKNDQI